MQEPEALIESKADVEIEIEKIDFGSLAYYASDVYTTLVTIDDKLFSESEKARLGKARTQSIKLMCYGIEELYKEHFPKPKK